MALDLTLPTIQSRLSLHALSRIGAQCLFTIAFKVVGDPLLICSRCTSSPDNLDSGDGLHSRIHTDVLLESGAISLKELWDDYGIVGDLIVSFLFVYLM